MSLWLAPVLVAPTIVPPLLFLWLAPLPSVRPLLSLRAIPRHGLQAGGRPRECRQLVPCGLLLLLRLLLLMLLMLLPKLLPLLLALLLILLLLLLMLLLLLPHCSIHAVVVAGCPSSLRYCLCCCCHNRNGISDHGCLSHRANNNSTTTTTMTPAIQITSTAMTQQYHRDDEDNHTHRVNTHTYPHARSSRPHITITTKQHDLAQ